MRTLISLPERNHTMRKVGDRMLCGLVASGVMFSSMGRFHVATSLCCVDRRLERPTKAM